jgi:hypothetical protein
MALEEMKRTLVKMEKETFRDYGLVFYPEVIVKCWDPYSLAPLRDKVYMLLKNAYLRLSPDSQVTIESVEGTSYLNEALAKVLIEGVPPIDKVPSHALEYTDIYPTKLESELMKKPLIIVPEKLEVQGGIVPYNASILQSLIADSLVKFGKEATEEQIIDVLTTPYPHGCGWYKRTATLIANVKQNLQVMANRGILNYDEQTEKYSLVSKPSTSQIKR